MRYSELVLKRVTCTFTFFTSKVLLLGLALAQPAQAQRTPSGELVAAKSCVNLKPMSQLDIEERASPANRETLRTNFGSFELATLESVNLSKNTKPYESPLRRRLYGIPNVVPDGVTGFVLIEVRRGRVYQRTYLESVFYDAKFVDDSINYRYDRGQTLGFIDHLDRLSPAGRVQGVITRARRRPTPELHYITPTNTNIGSSTLRRARQARVAVYQHVVCDTVPVGGVIGENDLAVGKGILLNSSVYRGRNIPDRADSGTAFGLPFTLSDPPEDPGDDGNNGGGGPCSFSGGPGCRSYQRGKVIAKTTFNFGKRLLRPVIIAPQNDIAPYVPLHVPSTSEVEVGKWQGQSWKDSRQKILTEEAE